MQIHLVEAPVFATNCAIVVADDGAVGADAVVIDAGGGVAATVRDLIARHGWKVRAVFATHGHVDHFWDAAELSADFDVPVRLHTADAYCLADPFGSLGFDISHAGQAVSGALRTALLGLGIRPEDYCTPTKVVPFDETGDADGYLVAGSLRFRLHHAPGHTPGSTLFECDGVLFSGDVLFAQGVGRTDLPGGNTAVMNATLRDVVAQLNPALQVVPGHGPTTTIAAELATNPYLRMA